MLMTPLTDEAFAVMAKALHDAALDAAPAAAPPRRGRRPAGRPDPDATDKSAGPVVPTPPG